MNQKLMDTEYHWLRVMCGGEVPVHVRELAEESARRFRMVSSAPLSRDTLALVIATADVICDCDVDEDDVPDKTLAVKKGSKAKPKGPKRPVKKPSYETPEEVEAVAKVAELVGA